MEGPDLLLLGYSDGRPRLNVVELATGDVAPSPVSLDGTAHALNACHLRDGWLAIDAGQEVWGVPLPIEGRAFRVAESSLCVPGTDGRTVWVHAELGRRSKLSRYVAYDGVTRAVLREIALPLSTSLQADTPAGVVGLSDGGLHLYDASGNRGDLLAHAGTVSTAGDGVLLCLDGPHDGGDLVIVDLECARSVRIGCPLGAKWDLTGAAFSHDASMLAVSVDVSEPDEELDRGALQFLAAWEEVTAQGAGANAFEELDRRVPGWRHLGEYRSSPHRLVVIRCADGELTFINGEFDNFAYQFVWVAGGRSIVFGAPFQSRILWLWRAGQPDLERLSFKRNLPMPLIDASDQSVFGDLRVSRLRAFQRPSWLGPIPSREQARLLQRARHHVRTAVTRAALPSDVFGECAEAIRLGSCVAGRNVPIGASRLGGRPDLPAHYRWPEHSGGAMAFLAQLRLDELHAALPSRPLPNTGLMLIFVAIEPDGGYPPARDGVHVDIVDTTGLKRRRWPRRLDAELRYAPALAIAEPTITSPARHRLETYASTEAVNRFLELTAPPGPAHQLFGHASTIQRSLAADSHQLLLQFDSDALVGASFGDGGRLHIWVPTTSTIAGRIDGCLVDIDSF